MVPRITSSPLPFKVILPAPTVGDVFNATPPPTDNTPPLPGAVLKVLLTTILVAVPVVLFAACKLIAPPPV